MENQGEKLMGKKEIIKYCLTLENTYKDCPFSDDFESVTMKHLKNTTDIQKDRFISFYGLDKNSDKGQTLGEIAEKYNCSTTAIRCSVISVKNKLSRLN